MQGFLRKMRVEHTQPVTYFLRLGPARAEEKESAIPEQEIPLNDLIGTPIILEVTGRIECLECGRASKKSFSQGYCYPCFKRLPQCDLCMMSPERCHFAKGTCRDEVFGQRVCMRPHLVYVANSSGIKVGITHRDNLPTRWIDQGAVQAVPLFETMTRQQAGFMESALTSLVSDKTNWRKMLKSEDARIDLAATRTQLIDDSASLFDDLALRFGSNALKVSDDDEVREFHYPVNTYPTTVKAIDLNKTKYLEATLVGIKGQYLIFDTGVINIRKYTSYELNISVGQEKSVTTEQLSLL